VGGRDEITMSNSVIILFGIVIALVGLILIATGLWLTIKPKGEVGNVVRTPIFTVQGPAGIIIIVLGLACLGGAGYVVQKITSPAAVHGAIS